MSEGYEDFEYKTASYIKGSEVTVDVNVTNSKIDVDANITNSEVNVNVTNPELTVNVSDGNINANITNSQIDVNVTNTELNVNVTSGDINANITNSQLDINVTDSQISLPIRPSAPIPMSFLYYRYKEPPDFFYNFGTFPEQWYPVLGITGGITRIYAYVKNDDTTDHTLTIGLTNIFGGTPWITKSVTVTAGYEGWVHVDFSEPFPTILGNAYLYFKSVSGVSLGAFYQDSPTTSPEGSIKPYGTATACIKIIYRTTTTGFIPIIGTVYSIPYPRRVGEVHGTDITVNADSTVMLADIKGPGRVLDAIVTVYSGAYDYAILYGHIDGVWVINREFARTYWMNQFGYENRLFGIRLLKYDTTNKRVIMQLIGPYYFRESFTLYLRNYSTTDSTIVRLRHLVVEYF